MPISTTVILISLLVALVVALLVVFVVWARSHGSLAFRRVPSSPPGIDPDPEDVEAPIEVYRSVYFATLAIIILLGGYVGYLFTHLTFTVGTEWNVGYLIWTLGVFLLLTRIRIVGPEVMMGVEVLGVPTIVVSGGPVLLFPGITEPRLLPRSTIQMELPDEPENIFRREDVEAVPEGKVPPIRITFAAAHPNDPTIDQTDPLNQRITSEVSVFTRWRIRNFWDFYVRINTLTQARIQLSDMCVARLQERLSRLTVAQMLIQQEVLNGELDNLVRDKTRNWGIELIDVRIKLIGLSHRLNQAIQGIAESVANRRSTVNNALATKERLTLEGDGVANATRANIQARGEGFKKMAEDLGVAGANVLGAETARAIGESPSTKIVVGAPGVRELAGLGAAVAEAMKEKPNQGAE